MGEPYCSNASDILISSLRNQRFTISSLCPHPLFMFMVVYPFCFNLTFTFLLFLYQAFCLSQSETFAITSNRELKTMGSRPANPVPNPDESSLSHIKSQDMLADKVVDQWDDSDTENSSGSASYQVVPYKNVEGENNLPVLSKKRKFIISTYSVQCSTCKKWRVVPSKLKYEQIRENIIQVPFSCKYVHGWKPQVTCHDPTDISEDNGMAWAIDIPCIPQTPLGWERNITLRNEQSTRFADV